MTRAAVIMLDCSSFAAALGGSDLVEVDGGFPVVVLQQVKVSHTHFTEVTDSIVSS